MTAIWKDSGTPSWMAPKVAFDFYEEAEISVPAPAAYEMWRSCAMIPVSADLFYHQPTIELIRAVNESYARAMVDWSRRYELHAECVRAAAFVWERKKPWYCHL